MSYLTMIQRHHIIYDNGGNEKLCGVLPKTSDITCQYKFLKPNNSFSSAFDEYLTFEFSMFDKCVQFCLWAMKVKLKYFSNITPKKKKKNRNKSQSTFSHTSVGSSVRRLVHTCLTGVKMFNTHASACVCVCVCVLLLLLLSVHQELAKT